MTIPFKEPEESSEGMVRTSIDILVTVISKQLGPQPRVYQGAFPLTQQALKSDETQEAEKSQSDVPDEDSILTPLHYVPDDDSILTPLHHVPDDDSILTPLHSPKSEDHGMPDEAEKSQSNVPDDDSILTPLHPLKYRERGVPDKAEERRSSFNFLSFSGLLRRIMWMPSPWEEQPKVRVYREICHGYGMAALVLSLLTFTAGMCPVSGTMCDVQAMAVSKGEVGIACLLTTDVRQTKHSIMIKYVKPLDYPDDVLECDWKSSEVRFHCLHTPFRAELIAIYPDRVLARLPKDRLENGTYRCQLVPPDPEPFTDCDICDPDDRKNVPTTEAPETLPTTLGHRELGGMKKKLAAPPDEPKPQVSVRSEGGQHGGLVAAVVILSIIVFCLLLATAAMVVFFLRYSGMIPGRNKTDERKPEEANGFIT